MKDLLLRLRVVVRTSNMKISRRRCAGDTSKHCNKKRAASVARLSFLIKPIKSLIFGVVVAFTNISRFALNQFPKTLPPNLNTTSDE